MLRSRGEISEDCVRVMKVKSAARRSHISVMQSITQTDRGATEGTECSRQLARPFVLDSACLMYKAHQRKVSIRELESLQAQ